MLDAVPCGREQAGEKSGGQSPLKDLESLADGAPLCLTISPATPRGSMAQQAAEVELQAGGTEPRGSPVIMPPTQAPLPPPPNAGQIQWQEACRQEGPGALWFVQRPLEGARQCLTASASRRETGRRGRTLCPRGMG